MNMDRKKIIVAQPGEPRYIDRDFVESTLDVMMVDTIEDLYSHILKDEIGPLLVEVLMKDPRFRQMSKAWHVKNSTEGEALEEISRYFTFSTQRGYSNLTEVDFDQNFFEDRLADPNSLLLKEVSFKSLNNLNPGAYRRIRAKRKEIEDANKKKEQKKTERSTAQKLARKLLREQKNRE